MSAAAALAGAGNRAALAPGWRDHERRRAESLAQLCRDHGHPARVVVGRKTGRCVIKVAGLAVRVSNGRAYWESSRLPCDRATVLDWLGY